MKRKKKPRRNKPPKPKANLAFSSQNPAARSSTLERAFYSHTSLVVFRQLECLSGRWLSACLDFHFTSGSSPAEPHPQHDKSGECADGNEQRIIWRSAAAGHERLVNFIQHRISRRAEERRKAPRPPPAFAVAAHTAIEQQAKDKILRKVCALSNQIVNCFELCFRN